MRRRGEGGSSLVELLAALAIFGAVVVSAGALFHRCGFEARRAAGVADAGVTRWETVRRLRHDVATAQTARRLRGEAGETLELVRDGRRILWSFSADEGLLERSAAGAPKVRPVAVEARFAIEAESGRAFVRYELLDLGGRVEGRALVGGAR